MVFIAASGQILSRPDLGAIQCNGQRDTRAQRHRPSHRAAPQTPCSQPRYCRRQPQFFSQEIRKARSRFDIALDAPALTVIEIATFI